MACIHRDEYTPAAARAGLLKRPATRRVIGAYAMATLVAWTGCAQRDARTAGETITPERAAQKAQELGDLCSLSRVTSLDAASAAELAKFRGTGTVDLSGLKQIDAGIGASIGSMGGSTLKLDGLTRIDAATARELVQFKGDFLLLNGLARVDAETANDLRRFQASLHLNGLKKLDAKTAGWLVQFEGSELSLGGIATMDADTARLLWQNPRIRLSDRFER